MRELFGKPISEKKYRELIISVNIMVARMYEYDGELIIYTDKELERKKKRDEKRQNKNLDA